MNFFLLTIADPERRKTGNNLSRLECYHDAWREGIVETWCNHKCSNESKNPTVNSDATPIPLLELTDGVCMGIAYIYLT